MNLLHRFTQEVYASGEEFQSQYHCNVPDGFNFVRDVMDEYARLAPNQRAMVWVNEQGEEHVFTFADMKRLSLKTAHALNKLGIERHDAVLVMLKRRYEYWMVALALMRLGCILIPATFQLQEKDIVYRAQASGARAILCVGEEEITGHVRAAAEKCRELKAIACLGEDREGFQNLSRLIDEAEETEFEPYTPTAEDVMLLYFTSGTTGMPKMVAHDYRYGLGHMITGAFWHNLNDQSLHLTCADSGWAKCAWGKFYGQWIAGACQFVYDFDKFVGADLLRKLEQYQVTSFCAPPTIYRFLIKEPIQQYDLSHLKWATTAGEPLSPEVFTQFYRMTGLKIHEAFGQTESTPLLLTHKWMEPCPGSTGIPSPHYQIRVLNQDLQEVEAGEEGELCVDVRGGRPAGLTMGYYRDVENTERVFRGGFYHTGDMVWRNEEGFFFFVGRADDVIKSSGYRIGPFEVESALISHPAVLECAITGVPHPDRGQVVKATVVLVNGYQPSEELKKELQNHVKKMTAPYKYPRIVEFVQELPKTTSGKIQRAKLRAADLKKQNI